MTDPKTITLDPARLDNRGVLRGIVCVCGQHWPDYVRTGHALQFRTECCGALYQLETGPGDFQTLNLVKRPAHLGPDVPTPANTFDFAAYEARPSAR